MVLAVVIGLYVQQGLTLLGTRNQAHQQSSLVRQLSLQNASLVSQEQSLGDPATIQTDARQLGMVRPGERPYVVIGLPQR